MNLLQIRQKFITLSGRRDLATSTSITDTAYLYDTDAGADFFIQSGSKELDWSLDIPTTLAAQDFALAIGEYSLKIQHLRAVQKVYYQDSDGKWVELPSKKIDQALEAYPKLGSAEAGTPQVYVRYPLRTMRNEQVFDDLIGLLILPPTDTATTIRVFGNFYSYYLEQNDDSNYWSTNHADVLVLAALRAMEGFYRNTQGVNDYSQEINRKLNGLDRDMVEADMNVPMQMNG